MKKTILLSFLMLAFAVTTFGQWQVLRHIDPDSFQELPISNQLKANDVYKTLLFDETGQKLFVGEDNKLSTYDVFSGEQLWSLTGEFEPNTAVNIFALTPDMFAVGNNAFKGGKVFVYTWNEGQEATYFSPYGVGRSGMASAYPDHVAWATFEGSIYGLNVMSQKLSTSQSGLQGHTKFEVALKFDYQGNLFSASPDAQLIQWDKSADGKLPGGKTVLFNSDRGIMSLDVSPYMFEVPYQNLVAVGETKGLVRIFERANDKSVTEKASFQVEDDYAGNVFFHRSDPDVVIVAGKQSLVFYDFVAKKEIRKIDLPAEIRNATQSACGNKLAVSLRDGTIKVYSVGRTLIDLKPGDVAKVKNVDHSIIGEQAFKFMGLKEGATAKYIGEMKDDKGNTKYTFEVSLGVDGITFKPNLDFAQAIRVQVEKM